MTYRHKNFDQSEVMREFEKLAQEVGDWESQQVQSLRTGVSPREIEKRTKPQPLDKSNTVPAKVFLETYKESKPLLSPSVVSAIEPIVKGIDFALSSSEISTNPIISAFGAGYNITKSLLEGDLLSAAFSIFAASPALKSAGAVMKDLRSGTSKLLPALRIKPSTTQGAVKQFVNYLNEPVNPRAIQNSIAKLEESLNAFKSNPKVIQAIKSTVKQNLAAVSSAALLGAKYHSQTDEAESAARASEREVKDRAAILERCGKDVAEKTADEAFECMLLLASLKDSNNKIIEASQTPRDQSTKKNPYSEMQFGSYPTK
jgi:hypothetical protein